MNKLSAYRIYAGLAGVVAVFLLCYGSIFPAVVVLLSALVAMFLDKDTL
jgi:hypothetical protein